MELSIEGNRTLKVVPYSEDQKEIWDDFIDHKAINGTFLHSRKFFDHNSLNLNEDASLIFYQKNKIIAVFPAVLYLKNQQLKLHSHLRATYGGIVVSTNVNVEIAIYIVQAIIEFAKERNVKEIIIRNSFRIYHKYLCDEADYAMWFNGFHIKYRELEISIPISGTYEFIKSRYHINTLRNVKKSTNLVVSLTDDYCQFWPVLEKCLMERHRQKPVHDLASIKSLIKHLGGGKVLLFGAYYQSKLVGGIVIFNFDNLVLHCQYIASDSEFNHLYPIHAIVDYLIKWGNNNGVQYLNLGMANEEEGRKINSGLFRFKEGFGGRAVLRETMYLELETINKNAF